MDDYLFVYVEVDSNDADYIGKISPLYSPNDIVPLLKCKKYEPLTDDEKQRITECYIPFIDNYYGTPLVERIEKIDYYKKVDLMGEQK